MDPLSLLIWLCIAVAYLAVSAVLYAVGRVGALRWEGSNPEARLASSTLAAAASGTFENVFTLQNSLWFSLGGFMRQSCGISPRY